MNIQIFWFLNPSISYRVHALYVMWDRVTCELRCFHLATQVFVKGFYVLLLFDVVT